MIDMIMIHWFTVTVTMFWVNWHTIAVVDTDNISKALAHEIGNDASSQMTQRWEIGPAKAGLNLTRQKSNRSGKGENVAHWVKPTITGVLLNPHPLASFFCAVRSDKEYYWVLFRQNLLKRRGANLAESVWEIILRQNIRRVGTNLAERVWQIILCLQAGSQWGLTGLALTKAA